MNKKTIILLMSVMVIVLSSCGTSKKAAKENAEEFMKLTDVYFEKQQQLMIKQSEGQSGDFAELSKHAQEVVDSKEYQEWEKEVKTIKGFKIVKGEKSEEYIKLQDSLNKYNDIQIEYFQELAKAKDADAYNDVNTDLATKVGESQEDFFTIMEALEE